MNATKETKPSALDRLAGMVAAQMGETVPVGQGTALDRLEAMVNLVQAKSLGEKLAADAVTASERVRIASERLNAIRARLDKERPEHEESLRQVEQDRVKLKQTTRTLAQIRREMDEPSRAEADRLIADSTAEIEGRAARHQNDLESLLRESSAARQEFQDATAEYQRIRKDMERLQMDAVRFQSIDSMIEEASQTDVSRNVAALHREVRDAAPYFGELVRQEQFLQLMIWIGRYRLLQQQFAALDLSDQRPADANLIKFLFPMIVGLSKTYQPGYIEAFQQGFQADWPEFIADAQERMRQFQEARAGNQR